MTRIFLQGYLDSMCGVYGIVNAYRTIHGASEEDCQILYNDIIIYLSKKRILKDVVLNGMLNKIVEKIMNDVVGDRIPSKNLLWRGQPNPNLKQYWNSIYEHLQQPATCVLINMDGRQEHITVGYMATKRSIKLVDSGGMKMLRYIDCTTTSYDANKYIIYPAQTWYLGR